MQHSTPRSSQEHFRSPLPPAHARLPVDGGDRPPYAIIAAMPGHKPREISRTRNRVDAEDMVRFLQRRVKEGSFYVVFDPADADTEGDNRMAF